MSEPDRVQELRRQSPLASAGPMLSQMLGMHDDAARLLILTDPSGTVLWRDGSKKALSRADGIGFYEGARWADNDVGTNAIGQTLVTGGAAIVQGEHHFAHSHAAWDCLSVPVHHPSSGQLAGVLDVSAPVGTTTRDTARLVQLAARLLMARWDCSTEGEHTSDVVELRLLAEQPAVRVDGAWRKIGTRAAEILALLEQRPGGWSAEELAIEVYGFDGNAVTVRTEVHRLRRILGPRIAAGPYRWADPTHVQSDLGRLRQAVVTGDVEQCLNLRHGGLLPRSTAPSIARWREEIDALVAGVVAQRGNPQQVRRCQWARIGCP
ncbi:helix-turn-helix domain-containing protein [Kocuria sp.]|uniref:helix-turn-helix domain-containing protein n=1 Tax=Kocuria sp. TaxID=1871328 RepID=UPI0026E0C499|nr:GAF domain-containing protein [Kocuria sp.]MDO5618876.1 GAF domain-containing protein [Kocuria sp.]